MNSDARKAEWLQMRRTTWGGFTGLTNRMIDSEAFQALRSVHSVKVLIYFWQKAEYAKEKRKPGHESPIGNLNKIRNQGEMSFEYRIAEYRGMRPDQFVIALRELFKYGFIDLPHHGRGVKGDYTKFSFSDRWKTFGSDNWQEIPFPDNDKVGFRSEEYKRRRRERERTEKSYYGKAELLTTESRSYSPPESPLRLRNRVVKKAVSAPGVTTESRSLLRSFHALKDLEGDRREGSAPESKVQSTAAAIQRDDATTSPKKWRPPLSEIRENVAEILRQRPDPRADDPRFVRFLADQLHDAQRGKLNPGRVHHDLQERHDLDDWTTDLLFAIATIDLIPKEATIQ